MAKILKKNCVYIYTDGSSLPKPRKGGIGIRYIYLDQDEKEHIIDTDNFGFEGATNNQMELKAVIEGLKNLKFQSIPIKFNLIEVRTDSKYVADHISIAIYSWSQNNWVNNYGKPIENAPLWKELIKVKHSYNCKVTIEWVKGHAKDEHNKAVDRLAKLSAKGWLNDPLFNVKLRKKQSEKSTKLGSNDMRGQKVSIHVINEEFLREQKISKYRYEIISKKSEFYKCVDFAYSEIHYLKAGHKYYVVFNKENSNPRILKMIRELK